MTVEVAFTGPLFDGGADVLLDELAARIQMTVGDQAFTEWESRLEESIRHSGPVYQRYLQVEDRDGARVVNDGWRETNDLPYGPWLEGVGSRNSPVTRFPGYHALEDAYDSALDAVAELAEPLVDEYTDRINHE